MACFLFLEEKGLKIGRKSSTLGSRVTTTSFIIRSTFSIVSSSISTPKHILKRIQNTANLTFFKTETTPSLASASALILAMSVSMALSLTPLNSLSREELSPFWTMFFLRDRHTGPCKAALTVNLLQLKMARVGFSAGRLANTCPLRIRASCANWALLMMIRVRVPILRVKMGP
uniref:Uncharacterized protein n=1 Tax=Opuntia streptacantha TaxID=393608 RepID=A0A7C8YIC1_OPUST